MKLNRKLVGKLFLASATLLSSVALAKGVLAEIQTDVINEKWGKPTLVYGGSLTDEQVTQVNNALGVSNIENVNRQVATGQDLNTYIGGDVNASMLSSVLVQKQDKGKGISVTIKTPELITLVTETQYANAAITAGATDVQIEVASPTKVTGESALTGVYKALSANGQEVDAERTAVAQEEVSVVSAITAENSVKEDYDSTLLDNALADIKVKLSEYKEKNGVVADNQTVTDIVNKVLKENGLDGVITPEQVASLVAFAEKYQNTSAIDDKAVLEQLGNLQDSISKNVTKLLESANEHGVFEKAGAFFKSLWDSIVGMFQ